MGATYEPKGKYYEDFQVGDEFCSQSRTITETDVVNFAGLSGDFVMLHTSEEYAATTMHKGRIAHGMLTMAIATGQGIQTGIFDGTILASLNYNITFSAVVHIGDTIHTVTKVTELRKTKKPGIAIMKVDNQVINQNGVTVLTHEDTLMIMCRHLDE